MGDGGGPTGETVTLGCEEVLSFGGLDYSPLVASTSRLAAVNPDAAANVLTGIQRLFTIAGITLVPE